MSSTYELTSRTTLVQKFFWDICERFLANPVVSGRYIWCWRVTSEKSMALFSVINMLGSFFQLFDKVLETIGLFFYSVRQNIVLLLLNNIENIATVDMFFQIYLSAGIWRGSTWMDRTGRASVSKKVTRGGNQVSLYC